MTSVRPIIKEVFSAVSEPMLIVNISGEVEYLNHNAKELFNINENENRKLELGEISKSSWTSFLNKIREQKWGTCVLHVKLSEYKYRKLKLEGFLYKKKKLIFVRVMNLLANSYKEIKEKYSSHLLDELSHGVVITDLEGIVLDLNKKALQFIQCEYEEIINKSHKFIFNKLEDFEFNKLKFYQDIQTSGQASIVLRNTNGNKEQYFKVESKLNCRKNIIVSTITDITLECELNNQLLRQDLSNEVCKVAASIAHEIRNPMTSLKGFIDLLKNSYSNSKEYERYLNVMESEINRIDNYLKDLLNTAKPSKGKLEVVDLNKITNEVIELMQPFTIKNNNNIITIRNENNANGVSILGNENRIKQLLINLIKNAIEVMDNGGCITVSLTNLNNRVVQLSVQDEGTGVSQEQIDNLFKPFYTTKENGTGLGLSIVKRIVEEHRGSIKVESSLNCGTIFYIELPIYDVNSEILKENEEIIKMWYNKSLKSIPIT